VEQRGRLSGVIVSLNTFSRGTYLEENQDGNEEQ
jgi:hypothetical protein